MSLGNRRKKVQIFLLDDHAVVREGLTRLLEQEPDLEVCGVSGSADALAAIVGSGANLVIVDLTLGETNGLELIRVLHEEKPQIPSLVFSMHEEEFYAERSMRVGASGYVMKSAPPATLIQAIRSVAQGELYLSPRMTDRMVRQALGRGNSGPEGLAALSNREFEIFCLVGQGRSNRDIAGGLNLSVKTIDAVKETLKRKLGLANTGELTRLAIEHTREFP